MMDDKFRISFLKGREAEDKTIFELWRSGLITAEEAALSISKNNKTRVTVEQFLANAQWLGYFKGED